jgi:hypothetical protein
MQRTYDLKLADGRVVQWAGADGVDAARRYVDCCGGTVVAFREPRVELVVGVAPGSIIG